MICKTGNSYRHVLAAAAAGAILMSFGFGPSASAQEFPSRNISITIPTAEGGGADRDARIFTQILNKYLDVKFEFQYYPGAAGQVGYEFFAKKDADPHNLLFANMGPEVIMLTLQDPGIELGEDIVYIKQTSSEPMAVWVGPNSPFQTLQELVEEAKKRPITVSTSRLPHPGSIGMLALGEATGAQFNLVPFGGGNPTAMAAITGEVDASVLPLANPVQLADQARILGIFANKNPAPEAADNAPTVNEALGLNLPPLTSSRAWAVRAQTLRDHPEAVEILKEAMQKTLEDPEYAAAVEKAGLPTAFIDPGDQEQAMETAEETRKLAEKYRDLLTGG